MGCLALLILGMITWIATIQVTIDGDTYLTHSANVILISK